MPEQWDNRIKNEWHSIGWPPREPDAPMLTDKVGATYRMGGQRFIEPGPYCQAIADSIIQRGGKVTTGVEVVEITSTRKPAVKLATGEWLHADNVVLATGAWLPKLAKDLGVTTLVQAGRGYSFSCLLYTSDAADE